VKKIREGRQYKSPSLNRETAGSNNGAAALVDTRSQLMQAYINQNLHQAPITGNSNNNNSNVQG
jgi:hypothetical protein